MSRQQRDQLLLGKAIAQGAAEMYRLRTKERLSFVTIASRTGRSRERVRQIIRLYSHHERLPFPGKYKG
ncbi:MAG: hypothetical protein ACTHM1_12070, partial [Solirubrobacteraceae bacterium]